MINEATILDHVSLYAIALLLAIAPIIYVVREVITPAIPYKNAKAVSVWSYIINPSIISIILMMAVLWVFTLGNINISGDSNLIQTILLSLLIYGTVLFIRFYLFNEIITWSIKEVILTVVSLGTGFGLSYLLLLVVEIPNFKLFSLFLLLFLYIFWIFILKGKLNQFVIMQRLEYTEGLKDIINLSLKRYLDWGIIANSLTIVFFTAIYWVLERHILSEKPINLIILIAGTILAAIATTLLLFDFLSPSKYHYLMKDMFADEITARIHYLVERKFMSLQIGVWWVTIGIYWMKFYIWKFIN